MTGLFPTLKAVGYAHVAVERAVDRYPDGLTYAIPSELADIVPGQRVLVPLGKSNALTPGYVVDRVDLEPDDDDAVARILGDVAPDKVKPIERIDDSAAILPGTLMALARWISGYYCCPIGMTLATMLPAAVKRNVGSVTKMYLDFGEPVDPDAKLPPKQRAVLRTLADLPDDARPIEMHRLGEMAGLKTMSPIKRLIERDVLAVQRRTTVEAVWRDHAIDDRVPERLTGQQEHVLREIEPALHKGFSTHLLYGVTGSGKTEIYIRLIERVLAMGKVALMLVPEISLTPQTGGRLIGRFPTERVAVLHSGLTAAQRHQQWALAAGVGGAAGAGGARVVLGARSAVFAPIPDDRLGLIIVDEEHDGSYKQDQAPRYHGRDVAIRRAHLAKCPIVLGSATPSLESWHNATVRKSYTLHRLPERAPGMKLPHVQIVDFAEQRRERHRTGDRRDHLIGPLMEQAIGRTLEDGGQVIILLNRRGFASFISCADQSCGWVMTCDHCDSTMVHHRQKSIPAGGFVRCHHCLTEQKLPTTCPMCGKGVIGLGFGTQKVEEELAARFPQLVLGKTMLRVDSDSMHGARDFHDALGRFAAGDVRLLLGTQMIAKGLDFPQVRLVGVINADTAINLPDFRATERTFQLVSQVAGRCGRSERTGPVGGWVIVQTFHPDAPAIQLAARHDYITFSNGELAERHRCKLPPFARMARIVVRDRDHAKALKASRDLAAAVRGLATAGGGQAIRVRGPAPCPIARVADFYRHHVEMFADGAGPLQSLLADARSRGVIRPGALMAIDVDPVALL